MSCEDHGRVFSERRPRLVGIAYRVLGTLTDAEDAVQETWLRWERTELGGIDNVDAYLVRAVTNTSLNRLRSARTERERYVGPWLPEPVVTEAGPEGRAELDESVSLAMLVVLETLSPLERVAFVLHEVFGYRPDEVAVILDRSPAAVRQLTHRAREHVRARRPRFAEDAAARRRATEAFLTACTNGSVEALLAVLAPEVTLWTDGGAKVAAARRPLQGADVVARFLVGILRQAPSNLQVAVLELNGAPGFVASTDDIPIVAGVLESEHGLVGEIRLVRNPDKLRWLSSGTQMR